MRPIRLALAAAHDGHPMAGLHQARHEVGADVTGAADEGYTHGNEEKRIQDLAIAPLRID
jgi:hypothetical protein